MLTAMRWLVWFLMAFAWGIQTALLWHGKNLKAAMAAGAAAIVFTAIGVVFYRRDQKLRQQRLKIREPR